MEAKSRSDYLPIVHPPVNTERVQIRLLVNVDLAIVGVDLQVYYLGKRDDKIEIPTPNAMRLVSNKLAAFCAN